MKIEDPDFFRFSFPEDNIFLFENYARLRSAWQASEIEITDVRHRPYLERISARRGSETASIQYSYNKNGVIAKIEPAPKSPTDHFCQMAIDIATPALLRAGAYDQSVKDPFLLELEQKIRSGINNIDIVLNSITSQQYRERFDFLFRGLRIKIDFVYNDKKQWKLVQEVGGESMAGKELKSILRTAVIGD